MEKSQFKVKRVCSVCLDSFNKDMPPYILDCGHNLCLNDLDQLFIRRNGQLGVCPICKARTNLQRPKNYELLSIMEEANKKITILRDKNLLLQEKLSQAPKFRKLMVQPTLNKIEEVQTN